MLIHPCRDYDMHSTFSAMTNDDQCSMQVDSDEDEGEEGRERGEREEREGSKEPAAEVVLVELASDGNNTTGTQRLPQNMINLWMVKRT